MIEIAATEVKGHTDQFLAPTNDVWGHSSRLDLSLSILVQPHRFAWEVFLAWKMRSSERFVLAVVIRSSINGIRLGRVLDSVPSVLVQALVNTLV